MRTKMFKDFIEKPISASEFLGKIFFLAILIILFLAIINKCRADWIELKDSSRVEGTIVGKDYYTVTIQTAIGQQIIKREDIAHIFISNTQLPALEIKTTHRYYLIPVFAGLALLTADYIADGDRLDGEIRQRKRYGLDTGDLKPARTRKYIFGILTGVASAATLAIIFHDVDIAVTSNNIQLSYQF